MMWRKFLRLFGPARPVPTVSSRVEDMARSKFPGDERGNPSAAQVAYRSGLAHDIRGMCTLIRSAGPKDAANEAADLVEAHFLAPRGPDGRPVA